MNYGWLWLVGQYFFFNAKLLAKQNNNINNLPLVRILALLALRDCSWSSILLDIAGLLKARRFFTTQLWVFCISANERLLLSFSLRSGWCLHQMCAGPPELWFVITIGVVKGKDFGGCQSSGSQWVKICSCFLKGTLRIFTTSTGFPVGRVQGTLIDQLGYNIIQHSTFLVLFGMRTCQESLSLPLHQEELKT